MNALIEYKNDLKYYPNKKYLKIKTMKDLVKAKLLEFEKKSLKKDYFKVTKQMNKALKLTNGVNFLPRNKIFNKKKKVNL
jgi:hypothetical protein